MPSGSTARAAILEFAKRAKVRGHIPPDDRPATFPPIRRGTFPDIDPEELRKQLSREAVKGWLVP